MDGNTINAVIEIINNRANGLQAMAKLADGENDHEFAQQLSMRAWELERVIEQIERAHAETPSSKAA
jgi:hypothetical protein